MSDELVKQIEELTQENIRLRAVLEGAEYPNIDAFKTMSVEKCRLVGSVVAEMTKILLDRNKLLM